MSSIPRALRKLLALASALVTTAAAAVPALWVSDSDGTLGRVDLASGAVTVVGQMAQPMTDIAFSAEGTLWGVDVTSGLWRIDPGNATSRFVGWLGTPVNALVFDSQGTLFAASDRLWQVDPATGRAAEVGGADSAYRSSGDLAFVGGALYLSARGPDDDRLLRIDAGTGAGVPVGTGLGVTAVYGLATDDNVNLYGLSGQSVVQIDPATGLSRLRVSYDPATGLGTAWGTAFFSEAVATLALPQAAPVPEPPAALLLGAGLWWAVRRMRRTEAPATRGR